MKGSDRTNYEGSVSISYRYKGLNFRDNLTITSNVANDSPYGAFSEYAVLNLIFPRMMKREIWYRMPVSFRGG